MKILQLRYLLAIADNGLNITIAADRLYTSQPGVSKQIKLLEEELGVELFIRNGKRLRSITGAGRKVIKHARVVMQEIDGIRADCRVLIDEEARRPPPGDGALNHEAELDDWPLTRAKP